MTDRTVSVALCTFNGEQFLGEQPASLSRQTHLPDELIVCDDRSTDGPVTLLDGFSETAPLSHQDHSAILVVDKGSDQAVSKAVAMLKSANRREAVQTLRDWRPWGWFETLIEGPRFHAKQLQVDHGHRLSLQKILDTTRSEHWVVVEGTATVTRGDETFLLQESESTFIPAGTKHRLANEGKVPLMIVEIQVGAYFGEDDIIRLTDDFGRKADSAGDPST